MLNRNITRAIFNTTEVTGLLAAPNGADYVFPITTTDALYLGYAGPFASRYFEVGVVNDQTSEVMVEYWDGSAWAAVDDLLDQTSVGGVSFAQSGFVSWANKGDWKASNQPPTDTDLELYWIKITVDADLNALTALKSILNVFSDDQLLAAYFPELSSDVNYLPTGQTNFLKQHVAAKDMVVLRLKQRKMIGFEWQIIDANDVAIASVYAAAKLILQPIATSPDSKDLLAIATNGFNEEISKITFHVDSDGDGVISDAESKQNLSVKVVRR